MKNNIALASDAHRFEYGNPNYLGTYVQRRGSEFISNIGLKHIESRVRELSTFLIESALQRGLKVRTPRDWKKRAGIVSLDLGHDAEQAVCGLAKKKIRVSYKDSHLRATVHIYNNEEDIINQLIVLSNPDKDVPTIFIWPEGVITSTYLNDISKYKDLFEVFAVSKKWEP